MSVHVPQKMLTLTGVRDCCEAKYKTCTVRICMSGTTQHIAVIVEIMQKLDFVPLADSEERPVVCDATH